MSGLITFMVFLPALVVWVLAVHDVLTRRDITPRRRFAVAVLLLAVFPLTVLYLLARPPSSVRRGPETADDPRSALLDQLDSSLGVDQRSAEAGELAVWVAGVLAPVPDGAAPGRMGR